MCKPARHIHTEPPDRRCPPWGTKGASLQLAPTSKLLSSGIAGASLIFCLKIKKYGQNPYTCSICSSEIFPPTTAPFNYSYELATADEPDETSFRALRPKTLRLTLDVTETVSCYSQSARTILGHCCRTVVRQRRGRGSSGLGVVSRTDVSPKRGCDFRISH